MAGRQYDISGPLQRSRSNNYYKPPVPPNSNNNPLPLPREDYEPAMYLDEKLVPLRPFQPVPPPPLHTNTAPAQAPLPPLPIPPPPKFEDATMVSIPADMFDRMFLRAQEQNLSEVKSAAAVQQHRQFANPTPLSVVGFLLALSPLSCDLMGWRGAGGNGAASIGAYFFIGGLLMLLGGVMEYIAGNTFPFVVFSSFGGFWFSYGATLLPFFNAFGAYSPSTDPRNITQGLSTQGFNASFGFFMIFMAVLCFVYLICALRTNLVFVIIFAGLFVGFVFLTATFWFLAEGQSMAGRALYLGGASLFVTCMAGWYLLLALLFIAVDFPLRLPLVDLSVWIKGFDEKRKGFGGRL